jgi:hypothetical protein
MTKTITTPSLPQSEIETTERLFDNWFDPIEAGLRERTREFPQAMLEAELDEVLARSRACGGPSSSSSTAHPGSIARLPPCGTAYRCNAARSTSTATSWRMHPSACTGRSPPITTT